MLVIRWQSNDWLLAHYWPSINRWVIGPTIGHIQCIDQHVANTLPTLHWDSTDAWLMYWLIMSTDMLVNTTYKTEIPLLLALLLTCLLFQVLDDFMYYGSCNLQAEVELTGFTLWLISNCLSTYYFAMEFCRRSYWTERYIFQCSSRKT